MSSFVDKVLDVERGFATAGVDHGFGGAIALAFHVLDPRNTDEIDVNVSRDPGAALSVLRALPAEVAWTEADARLIQQDGQHPVALAPRPGATGSVLPQHELHRVVQRDTVRVAFAGTTIPIISATHLTVFKSLFNRSRDWPDIEGMLSAGTVDGDEALRWVGELLGDDSEECQRLAALSAGSGDPSA